MRGWLRGLGDTPDKAEKRVREALLASGLPHVRDAVIPDQVGGYTQVDHLLLTAEGLVLLEVQHLTGELHGSSHTQRWTRFGRGRRHEFDNPFRRLRELAETLDAMILGDLVQVAVEPRLVVTGPARFVKGVPEGVLTEPMLRDLLASRARAIPARQRAVWDVLLGRVACDPVAPSGSPAAAQPVQA
ncbi:MAG: NERD domain-containing protein [Halothiobacillaceae bacterium]|nr:MAG: NERD domain-containing protein [Halothiobacillaceae bacterium]